MTVATMSLALELAALAGDGSESQELQDRDPRQLVPELARAQIAGEKEQVYELVSKIWRLLGDRAGDPEVPDTYRTVFSEIDPLDANEACRAFLPYFHEIHRRRAWKIGEDPTKTPTGFAIEELSL